MPANSCFCTELCQGSEGSCAEGADSSRATAATGGKCRKLKKKFLSLRG